MSIVSIDNTDSSITWTGSWESDMNPQSPAYNHTASGSKRAGDTALVIFTGTSITVYGTITHGINISKTPLSAYTLNDDPTSGSFQSPHPTTNLYRQIFFESPTLPYGTHKLNVTDMTTTDTGLWLDYFVVTTGMDANTTSESSAQSMPQPTESTGTTTQTRSNWWIIAVSVVVGGCAILAALALSIYIARRRRLKQSEVPITQTVEPFLVQPSFHHQELYLESPYRLSGTSGKARLSASSSVMQPSLRSVQSVESYSLYASSLNGTNVAAGSTEHDR
ncbi:hypothetical protein D9619_000078 [Psilocybe cf. subviscida]|uniref:Uncharacterized protein n=1 Tax=Psilocybe cf. subviscida TaxID=2480587 RepID=A0A8H5F390_9AGAR|nr:hypothetical protein D9619_000078 [Psilocybe cf. subviscida]